DRLGGKVERDAGPLPQPAAEVERSAMLLDQRLDQRKAQPGTAIAAAGHVAGLLEGKEHLLEIRLRDADTVVADSQAEAAGLWRADDAHRAAGLGELNGVRQQVDDHLLERPPIGPEQRRLAEKAHLDLH